MRPRVSISDFGIGRRRVKTQGSLPDGFTLIEILVALAILSISLTVLLAAFSQVLNRARDNEFRAQARVLAQSLLAGTAAEPPERDLSGRAANGLTWQIHSEPYLRRDAVGHGPDAVVVSATVMWRDGDRPRSLTLTTLEIASRQEGP